MNIDSQLSDTKVVTAFELSWHTCAVCGLPVEDDNPTSWFGFWQLAKLSSCHYACADWLKETADKLRKDK